MKCASVLQRWSKPKFSAKYGYVDGVVAELEAQESFWYPALVVAVAGWAGFVAATYPVVLDSRLRDLKDLASSTYYWLNIFNHAVQASLRVLAGMLCDCYSRSAVHGGIDLITWTGALITIAASGRVVLELGSMIMFNGFTIFSTAHLCATQLASARRVGFVSGLLCGISNFGSGCGLLLGTLMIYSDAIAGLVEWRLATILPALLLLILGYMSLRLRFPLYQKNLMVRAPATGFGHAVRMLHVACKNYRVWVLTVQYAASFGLWVATVNQLPDMLVRFHSISQKQALFYTGLLKLTPVVMRPLGGALSDAVASGSGMKGRLFFSFAALLCQGGASVMVPFFSFSLGAQLALSFLLEAFSSMAHASTFAILPFITFRAEGAAAGMVAGGGVAGAILMLAISLSANGVNPTSNYIATGVWTMSMAVLTFAIRFPMWSTITASAKDEEMEEDYYMNDYTEEERNNGVAALAIQFAEQARYHRGPAALLLLAKEYMEGKEAHEADNACAVSSDSEDSQGEMNGRRSNASKRASRSSLT